MDVRWHPQFCKFFGRIKDAVTKAELLRSIKKLEVGKAGNTKSVGGGVWELKVDYGAGWRIYYTQIGSQAVLLITGGTKNGQQQDIEAAKKIVREIGR